MTLTVNPAYAGYNDAVAKHVIHVFEIMAADGSHGTEGINDLYLGSEDVSAIANFPYPDRYYPVLDSKGISGLTQRLDLYNGTSTIGSMSHKLNDSNRWVSDNIRAMDLAGHGLRRQLAQHYMLFKGMDWADRIKVRTIQIDNLRLGEDGISYKVLSSDRQTDLKRNVFMPKKTQLAATLLVGDLSATFIDASAFPLVTNHFYGTNVFFKIQEEMMRGTVITGNVVTIHAQGRGMFGTTPAQHEINDDITEIIVLRENPITMALSIMMSTGAGTNGVYDVYPKHWGLGLTTADINVAEWLSVGQQIAGLDNALPGDGMQAEFKLDKKSKAKSFIELQLLRMVVAYGFVHGDGSYGVRAYNDLANADKTQALTLGVDDFISWGELDYDYPSMVNLFLINFDEKQPLSGKLKRSTLLADGDSITKWGETEPMVINLKGVVPLPVFVDPMYQRLLLLGGRLSRPPLKLKGKLHHKHHLLEIGDIRRIILPVYDLLTGADVDRAFQINSVNLNTDTSTVDIELEAQPEASNLWASGTVDGNPIQPPTIADAVYQQGTQINWDGLGGSQSIVSGQTQTLAGGDHWTNGNLTVPAGATLSISATTRLFATGQINIDGNVVWNRALFLSAANGYMGFGGGGGVGFEAWSGGGYNDGYGWYGQAGDAPVHQTQPTIIIAPTSVDPATGSWTAVSGIPSGLEGSAGGNGGDVPPPFVPYVIPGGVGAASPPGLLLFARGIFVSSVANIDLRGLPAVKGTVYQPANWAFSRNSGDGGPSGGGTFVALAERDLNGLPVLDVDVSRVHTEAGSIAGTNATAGSDGGKILQVIG